MNNETGKQLIKSATAVLCVAGICISAVISTNKVADTIKATAASSQVQQGGASYGTDSIPTDSPIIDSGANGDAVTDAAGTNQTDAAQPDSTQSGNAGSGSSQTGAGSSNNQTSSKPSGSKVMSKAEIINYCNTALNKAKAAKVGYNKKMVREVKGSTDGISPSLIKLVAVNKNTTMKKGSDNIKDDFPAAGFEWSSKLREQDVVNATIKTSGQYYEIRLTLGKEQNPAKGEKSSYGRVMSVIDAAEAGKMVPGIKSINMNYHDGYVYAKVDSKTGKLVAAEFSAAADIQANITIFGSVSVKDIVSTETFTNIVW
ncbi:MAG TPA: hypothetical protein DD393_08460 [Ruminococcaceae bacterium]|jgi:hypothetical protein|nr:hypothetical protein [Oscillospiraceae bacterium]